ncbi:MAG: response regulator transcription factor [Paraclostridium sp.]|uniref:response regulator transcription factor n=1 Tax=Paraclostridium sp. TaxID=2023273 RepID=UPI003F365B34
MNVLMIMKNFIAREAINILLKKHFDVVNIDTIEDLHCIETIKINNYDTVFIDGSYNILEIEKLLNSKSYKSHTKTLILDNNRNENLLIRSIKSGVDAYICGINNEYEFNYIIDNIKIGKKFYDSDLIESYIKKKDDIKFTNLTNREIEIMDEVCKGLSNIEIGNNLCITEFTVKKHISSILSKLNLKNRRDIILCNKNI